MRDIHIRHNTPCDATYENYETIVLPLSLSSSSGGRMKLKISSGSENLIFPSLSFLNKNKFN